MPLLSAGELTAMRAVQSDTLPDTAVIRATRRPRTGWAAGRMPGAAIGTVDGRIAPAQASGSEQLVMRPDHG